MISYKRGQRIIETSPTSPHERNLLRLAFLAPDIQKGILTGYQPPALNLQKLRLMDIPLCWAEQRDALGWPAKA